MKKIQALGIPYRHDRYNLKVKFVSERGWRLAPPKMSSNLLSIICIY
jgi:hypothetical protein